MQKIIIPNPKNASLLAQLIALCQGLQKNDLTKKSEIDLKLVGWFYPFLTLTLGSYINKTKSNFDLSSADQIQQYLNIIKFPKGISSISEYSKSIQQFKNYIPISTLRKKDGKEREDLEYLFLTLIYKNLENIEGTKNAVYYPITELLTNIFEHSQAEEGYLLGQYYPKKNYLDICIADTGRGLKQAYLDDKKIHLSNIEALIEVMKGNSTKPSKERGYGVRTSKRVICQALKGEFIMLSGNAALYATNQKEEIINLSDFSWPGVIIAYRVPKPDKSIDITPYLE